MFVHKFLQYGRTHWRCYWLTVEQYVLLYAEANIVEQFANSAPTVEQHIEAGTDQANIVKQHFKLLLSNSWSAACQLKRTKNCQIVGIHRHTIMLDVRSQISAVQTDALTILLAHCWATFRTSSTAVQLLSNTYTLCQLICWPIQ